MQEDRLPVILTGTHPGVEEIPPTFTDKLQIADSASLFSLRTRQDELGDVEFSQTLISNQLGNSPVTGALQEQEAIGEGDMGTASQEVQNPVPSLNHRTTMPTGEGTGNHETWQRSEGSHTAAAQPVGKRAHDLGERAHVW